MAVTKIHPVKSTLAKALDYILDPAKTDGKMLVSSFACSYETADIEFEFTLSKALAKGSNLAHHLIQSFEPGETTPELAHEIGKRLADEVLGGRYEYVLTTHIDKGHIHNHIMFCAASFTDYRKYNSNKKSYATIRRASDRLCKEYGLTQVIPRRESAPGLIEFTDKADGRRKVRPAKGAGKTYAEYAADKTGGSYKSKLRIAIDTTISQSTDFEDFLRRMELQGYEIKRGKFVSFRAPGQERFTRAKTLGEDYTEEAIAKRIAGEYTRAPRPARSRPTADATVGLLIDIENNVKAQQSAGYSRWAKIANLKRAAKTLNFLTENNLLHYADLEAKTAEVSAAFDEAAVALKAAEGKLTDMAVLIKHITTYQQTKPIANGLRAAKDKDAYHREHERELILHGAAARAIKAMRPSGGRLPALATLRAEHARLTKRKDALRADYAKLRQAAREYGVILSNVDSILNPGKRRGRDKGRKERDAEL
jgi:hypothetical protein